MECSGDRVIDSHAWGKFQEKARSGRERTISKCPIAHLMAFGCCQRCGRREYLPSQPIHYELVIALRQEQVVYDLDLGWLVRGLE